MADNTTYVDLADTVRKAAEAHRKVMQGIATHAEAERDRRLALHEQLTAQHRMNQMTGSVISQ